MTAALNSRDTFVFTRFSFISPEQRGWIVSGDKKKLKSLIGSHNIHQHCGHCNVMVEIVLVKS